MSKGKVYRVTMEFHVPSYIIDGEQNQTQDLLDHLQMGVCERGADLSLDDFVLIGDSDEVD